MKKISISKVIIALLFIFILQLVYGFCTKTADNKINDFFLRKIVSVLDVKAKDDVVLIVADKRSLEEVDGKWTRKNYSDIFDFLEFHAGAKAIILNTLITSPDTYNPVEDDYFYNNLSKHKILINSYTLLSSPFIADTLPEEYVNLFKEKSGVKIVDKRKHINSESYKAVIEFPLKYIENSHRMGNSFIPEDYDTIVRMYTPVVSLNGQLLPSVALSAYSIYSGINSFDLYDDYLCSSDDCKTFKMPLTVKITKDYIGNETKNIVAYIRWFKPIRDIFTHKSYSAIDIINSYKQIQEGKEPIVSPDLFKDKIVIVGVNSDNTIWDNLSETPVLKKQADIDVHATMIDNMIENVFKTANDVDYTPHITVLFFFVVLFGFKRIRPNIILASVLSLFYLCYYFYEYFSCVFMPHLAPIFIALMTAVLKWIYSVVTADKNAENIKRAMGKYISQDVMKTVLKDENKLKLGGERTIASVMFIDIRNFTGISENLSPSDVTAILNEYFSVIEPIIAKYHGVINKYLGDGVLSIFGDPIKNDNHAYNAIKCADEILSNVKFLQAKLLLEGKPKIEVGIGINTGEVFAGNIGTEERLEYTIIGDNVNLAYRIESYNRILKTQFLISEYTYNSVKEYIDVVKLSNVSIKGKSQPIDIYEVLKVRNQNET